MKTLVLFDTPLGLYSLMLSEMPLPPVEGRQYVFSGKRFEVIEIIECLGTRDDTGRVRAPTKSLWSCSRHCPETAPKRSLSWRVSPT